MLRPLIGIVAASVATSASAMPVATFLAKADALKAKGPLALLSGDYKLLMGVVKGDAQALKGERDAAKAANRKPAYCPPGPVELSSNDILAAMRPIPAAERTQTDSRAALRTLLARRYPCA